MCIRYRRKAFIETLLSKGKGLSRFKKGRQTSKKYGK
jgi:hypothetical protein